jgi:hypothetical protein
MKEVCPKIKSFGGGESFVVQSTDGQQA